MTQRKAEPTATEIAAAESPKTRTWWHPLLVRVLSFLFRDACEVLGEVQVGNMPLRLDVVVVRRRRKQLPQMAVEAIGSLTRHLNRHTLIEFKGPTDVLEAADLDYLLACAFLYLERQTREAKPLANRDVNLWILTPSLSQPFREHVQRRNLHMVQESPGVHRLDGGPMAMWVFETDAVDDVVLPLFGRSILRDRRHIMETCERAGFEHIVKYVTQQVHQFRQAGEEFDMRHRDTKLMKEILEDLDKALLAEIPPEKLLATLTPEQRLASLTPEQRLAGLKPEELVAALGEREKKQLRKLLGAERR